MQSKNNMQEQIKYIYCFSVLILLISFLSQVKFFLFYILYVLYKLANFYQLPRARYHNKCLLGIIHSYSLMIQKGKMYRG